jgi:GxxExxY protein
MDGAEFSGVNDLLTEKIIGVFYEVYNELGFGFLESVYRESMRIALFQAGLRVEAEVPVPVSFRGNVVGVFRADLVVDGRVVVELKTADLISKAHEAQVLHYLRASPMEIGLLMNFGPDAKFRRIIMQNARKKRMSSEALQEL